MPLASTEHKNSRYYVYFYLRPEDCQDWPPYTPYYVGKGTRNRAWQQSTRQSRKPKDRHLIYVYRDGLSSADATTLEIKMIEAYGRIDLCTGCLENKTDGGEISKALPEITPEQAARFWAKVDIRGENECWPWLASVNPKWGYGQFGLDSRLRSVRINRGIMHLTK